MSAPIPELRFSASEIREREGLARALSVPGAALGAVPPGEGALQGPVALELEFSVGGNRILLQARASGTWRLPCSRCLAEHAVPFRGEIEETYPMEEPAIDLTEDVRQCALLELPARSLCRQDCRGLCARCGKNLNEGPCGCPPPAESRFDALKKVKARLRDPSKEDSHAQPET